MNWFVFFLIAFIISSLLSFSLTIWVKEKSKFFFRLGGIAVISSFVITVLIVPEIVITSEITALMLGSMAILVFGFLDDYKNFNWKIQSAFQLFLALILIWFGFKIDLISFSGNELLRLDYWDLNLLGKSFSVISGIFIIFWLTGIINAVNWLDGSDGLLSVAGILSLLAVFFVSLRPEVNQPALAVISMIGIGAFSGFFIFNFPSAKIEAGTSGSYFAGFLLASLAIIAGTKIATTMVVLILPVIDFIWVIIGRIKDGQSIFRRDDKKRHLHYKLLSLGFSPKQVLLSYGVFLSLALIISFFVVNQVQKIILLITEFMMISLFIISLSKEFDFKKIVMKIKKILLNPVWLIVFILTGLMLVGFCQKQKNESDFQPNAKIEIAEKFDMKIRIVQTPEETYQGLGGFQSLPKKNGMLFLYNRMSSSSHVMRGMQFDLDFVFLRDNEVVFIQEKIPQNFKGIIQSPFKCNQVLEINAGEVSKFKIKVGDKIKIVEK